MTVLVDNTVLSNFALIERMDLLRLALSAHAATTPQVMREFRAGAIALAAFRLSFIVPVPGLLSEPGRLE